MNLCQRCHAQVSVSLQEVQTAVRLLSAHVDADGVERVSRDSVLFELLTVQSALEQLTPTEQRWVFVTGSFQALVIVGAGPARLAFRRNPGDTWGPPVLSTVGG